MPMDFELEDGLSFIREDNIKVLDGIIGPVSEDIVLATNLGDSIYDLLDTRDQEALYENIFVLENRDTLDLFRETILNSVNSLDYGWAFHDLFVFLSSSRGNINTIKLADEDLEDEDYSLLIYFISQDYYEDFLDSIFERGLDSERVMLIESDHKEGKISQGFYI